MRFFNYLIATAATIAIAVLMAACSSGHAFFQSDARPVYVENARYHIASISIDITKGDYAEGLPGTEALANLFRKELQTQLDARGLAGPIDRSLAYYLHIDYDRQFSGEAFRKAIKWEKSTFYYQADIRDGDDVIGSTRQHRMIFEKDVDGQGDWFSGMNSAAELNDIRAVVEQLVEDLYKTSRY